MRKTSKPAVLASMVLMLIAVVPIVTPQDSPSPGEESSPRKIGLEERAGTRLAQLDIQLGRNDEDVMVEADTGTDLETEAATTADEISLVASV